MQNIIDEKHTILSELTNWYKKNQRDLPWRENKNPYYIWLSEIILQQTRVSQGLSYYYKFISDNVNVNVYQNVYGRWTKIGENISDQGGGDYSALSLGLSDDGNSIAIAGKFDVTNPPNSGHVRVFTINPIYPVI